MIRWLTEKERSHVATGPVRHERISEGGGEGGGGEGGRGAKKQ